MSDKLKNVLIGSFVLVAIMIAIGSILFLKPSIGDGKKTVNVRFSNIFGINIGTRVTFAGRPIGRVKEILKIPDARYDIKDENGKIYCYELKLKVDSHLEIYDSDIVTLQTTGLMGEKSIAIIPKKAQKKSYLITNQVIYAKTMYSFENAAEQIAQLSIKTEKTLDNFNSWFEKNSNLFSRALYSISNLLENIDSQKLASSLNESINSFNSNMNHITQIFERFNQNDGINKINTLIDNAAITSQFISNQGKEIVENLKNLSYALNNSKNNIGRLLNSEDLYLQTSAILSKANTLFNDINNYGLLFQYSKSWQRLRTKRANILESLSKPSDFKNYFEREISEITTALNRIHRLIEKAEDNTQKQKILDNENFKRNFAHLLRQVKSLQDIIKLYNESLVDSKSE